jgi:hypothetical protein
MNWNKMGRLLGVALLIGVGISLPAEAGPIKGFSGYTRPGYSVRADEPGQDVAKQDFIKGVAARAADPKREVGLGATVYFMVIDRVDGTADDPWGLGADLNRGWQPGREADGARASTKLDNKARYLYLYQIINDSGEPSQIKMATIRLLVDPEYITSWGWIGEKKDKDMEGSKAVGFSMEFGEEKERESVRAVSTASPGVSDREYRPMAPAFSSPKPYGMLPIHLGNIRQVASKGGEKDDTGREPEQVHLLNEVSDSFGTLVVETQTDTPRKDPGVRLYRPVVPAPLQRSERNRLVPAFQPLSLRAVGYDPYAPLSLTDLSTTTEVSTLTARALEDPLTRLIAAAEQSHRSFPALRAYWLDSPLKPGERSGLFGFTSNLPPMYDKVRVRANKVRGVGVGAEGPVVGVAGGAPDVRPANLASNGTVPVPVPPLEEALTTAAAGPGITLGSFGGGGGTGGGGGGPAGGGGGGFPGLGNGLGGVGVAAPPSSNSNNPTPTPTPPTPPTPPVPPIPPVPPPTPDQNQSVVVNVSQFQQQQQQQAQLQAQLQINKNINNNMCCCTPTPPNVIPEPAALLTTTLCLPFLALVYRRRKPDSSTEAPAEEPVA